MGNTSSWLAWGSMLLTIVVVGSVSGSEELPSSGNWLASTGDVPRDPLEMSRLLDRMIEASHDDSVTRSGLVDDQDFIRRVTLDLAGVLPQPNQVIRFGFSDDPRKRERLISELLESDQYARNWARYWRDVIFVRATNARAGMAAAAFEDWMAGQLRENQPWDAVVTQMVTATGDVRENGATALIFAQEGEPDDLAAETSRIFLGIQLQCANCHDHPWDSWKREQFHELAAFFPRISVRPVRDESRTVSYEVASVNRGQRSPLEMLSNPFVFRRLDRNGNGGLEKSEIREERLRQVFDRVVEQVDTDRNGLVSREELAKFQPPNRAGRGSLEHRMPDLEHPDQPGREIQPVFFVDGSSSDFGEDDQQRRQTLAASLTDPNNPWFARAIVNRMWSELLGSGFYMPIDDIGPARTAVLPDVLETLSAGFVRSGYDLRWLLTAIMNTDAYQRSLANQPSDQSTAPFAHGQPTRLRADQLFDAVMTVLGIPSDLESRARGGYQGPMARRRSPRVQFQQVFGFDPSTPQTDLTGSIPQALLLMNAPQLNQAMSAQGGTRLARLLREHSRDEDAIRELYLLVLIRDPSDRELQICRDYVRETDNRSAAFEDLMWSLMNSTEFQTRR